MNLTIAALWRQHCKIWIFVVLLTPVAPTIAAPIVIDTFGPGNTYNTTYSLAIGDIAGADPGSPHDTEWAIRFDVPGSAPFKIDTIQIAAHYIAGTPNHLDVQIRTDANGSPGQIIDSLSFTNVTQHPGQVLTGTPNQMAVLSPAGRYWISASSPRVHGDAFMGWFSQPANGLPRPAANRSDGGSWEVLTNEFPDPGVFRITGIQIPEPSTSILLAASVYLWVRRRGLRPFLSLPVPFGKM